MTKDDLKRYSRQLLMPEIGLKGQEKIHSAKVLVIGAGGLGCPILQYLAAAGVGTIGIVDFDKVEIHNLHRQILHMDQSVGDLKVYSALDTLKRLNPTLNYIVLDEKITVGNAEKIMEGFDIVVDGSDNFNTRYLVNDTCVQLEKTLVYGSILSFEGQIAVFNHNGSKNLRDLFPEAPNPEDVPNCGVNGVLGSLPGIIGTMMAHETLKLIIGLPILNNELIVFNTLQWNFTKLNF